MTYAFLLESVWHPPLAFAETNGAAFPPELELQALWFAGSFGRIFRTTDGRAVRIIQFGEWNRGAGPDFAQVAVEIDGDLKTGDLELDTTASDWESHGHSANEAFRNVILHVVFQAEPRPIFTRTDQHREVPQVVISSMQLADAMNRPQQEVAIARPGRCVAPLRGLPIGAIDRLLEEAAKHRAAVKAAKFLRIADAHGIDAALFQATAETLGYRGNGLAMRLLTQRAPLAALRGGDADSVEALLFGSAGFLSPALHERAPADTRDYLENLWETWWRERAKFEVTANRAIHWKTFGQRPANHPHRRIGALAVIVKNWTAYRKVALARPFQAKPVIDFLESLEHPFWSKRHTLSSAASPVKIALFGRSQALELLANHLIPLALHEDAISFRDYFKLRSSAPNDKVKRCALRLFGTREAKLPWLKRVCHHQALLQVYHDFCLEDFSDCANCPFPEQLAQWR
jgi:hypothetical protein